MKMLWDSGKFLLYDMISTVFFLVLYGVTHSIPIAVGVGIVVGVSQIAYELARRRPVDAMQWVSVALVISTGIGALLTRDPRIILIKPSVIYAIIGAAMLKPGWMKRYMPPEALQWVPDLAVRWGFVWAALMFLSAALSLTLAFTVSFAAWVLYMSIWSTGSKIALFAVQFTSMRMIGHRRAAAQMAAA